MSLKVLTAKLPAIALAREPLTHVTLLLAASLTTTMFVLMSALPEPAQALLKQAAEDAAKSENNTIGKNKGTYDTLTTYFDKLASFAIWAAIPAATLGVVAAGGMFMAGNRRAGSVAVSVVGGLAVIVSAKTISS